ncbi:MAG TPA: hypothetical protein DDZ99_05245 [Clostridiales bacterium]|nr:hypothetical protein [Clostridiales bacterium]
MTIPEASLLMMQTGIMAQSGELFVLDMGKPIKIVELAENIIKLSGLVPYQDIDIVEIGLRPGEKHYEELLIKNKNSTMNMNKMIFIEADTTFTRAEIDNKLDTLRLALVSCSDSLNSQDIKTALKQTVTSYLDPDVVNGYASESFKMKLALKM